MYKKRAKLYTLRRLVGNKKPASDGGLVRVDHPYNLTVVPCRYIVSNKKPASQRRETGGLVLVPSLPR